MRISSPEPTDRIDAEESSSPAPPNLGRELARSGDKNSGSSEDSTKLRPPSNANHPDARPTATFKKPKAIAKSANVTSEPCSGLRSPELDDSMQETSEPVLALLEGHKATPKTQADCPTDDEKDRETAPLSEEQADMPTSPQQSSPSSEPAISREELTKNSGRDIEFNDVGTIFMVGDAGVEVDDKAPSSQGKFLELLYSDELLAALSRAAKKATRSSFPEPKAVQSRSTGPTESFSPSVGGQIVTDERTTTTGEYMEPSAPESPAPAEKAQPKPTSPKVLPNRQPKSVKHEKRLAEKQAPPEAALDVPQASKVHQLEEFTQAIEATSKGASLDNKARIGERVAVKHARPPPNGRSGKTTQRTVGPSKAPSDDYSTPRIQGASTSDALESFGQSTNYKPNAATGRIQEASAIEAAPITRLPAETPSTRRLAGKAPVILVDLVDADSEEDEPLGTKTQPPVAKPVFLQAQKTILSNSITARPRSQPEVALQAAAKIRPTHNAFERLIRSPHHGPKSALASPQKRTVLRAGRPSVSFVDTPSPARRRSSDSPTTGRFGSEQRDARLRMLAGASARTGSAIMQIVEVLDAIQTTIAENLSEKVQTVTHDARNARAELTRTVVAKLGAIQAQAEHHCSTLREFEGVFATQTQEFLDGCNRIDKSNTEINVQVQEVTAENARAGQRIAKMAVDFELPEAVSVYLISN
ncbi:hypothetical protein FRC08_010523 [Ceratobasidium sp. 394]|nr:hypothetical protein FRC08_010523 [Ceratobasidium sp. 394]